MSDHYPTTGPPFDIRAAGEELLGEHWQNPLAYMLGLNPRTVQR